MKSIIAEKEKIKKLLLDKFSIKRGFKKDGRQMNEYVDLIYDEIYNLKKIITEKSNWYNSSNVFLLGIFLGITANLFSNIIDNFLKPYNPGYGIAVTFLFVFYIREAFRIINNPYNPTEEIINGFYKNLSDKIDNHYMKIKK